MRPLRSWISIKRCLSHIAPAHNAARNADVLIFERFKIVADFLRERVAPAHRHLERVAALLLERRELVPPDLEQLA